MTTATNVLLPHDPSPSRPAAPGRSWTDTISRAKSTVMVRVCIYFTVIILALLAVVTGFLTSIGADALSVEFFTEVPTGNALSPGGMKHAIVGSGILIGLASLVGIPVGMLAGVYLAEYEQGSWLAAPARFICDVLAGVPSIVVGILGYQLLVVPLGGRNGWAGAAALAFIMIPIAARTTEEMLRLVPGSYREASIALGASKARTILSVVLPAATGSVVTGIMLAIARVAGETAPLLFTAGISRYIQTDPSEQFPSLTAQIYEFANHPTPQTRSLAWGGILVLIALIFIINLTIRFVTRGKKIGGKQ
jgi:phosphate transport system permease protein